ncbi:GNAT family N-acetyltransferase [Sphingomonas sp. ID1715]|uniref:GNAT family N-acetyltransferase n=1 Tax=Sphingomonas sp. ID1715 TaxID=1656898 RepID=UPI0014877E46|nr:GNAT family N-acetyltransferase [Sphingomonas sp. ID1715]NNM77265.1 GNAT family N-acetyltransferase [Sphingomonas sp. ID1715]
MDDTLLDRPVWHALTSRQAGLAVSDGQARRYRPDINVFAAGAEYDAATLASLGTLAQMGETMVIIEGDAAPPVPGTRVDRVRLVNQMVWDGRASPPSDFAHQPLGDADAGEMLALATLTAPGPFSAATHLMGDFIGVRDGGQLAAMAGQRFRLPGYAEVSAVCTHPDHRGKGHAGKLMQVLIARILAEGDTPFLHTYPDNAGAIRLYETLGFRFRRALTATFLSADSPSREI